VVKPLTRFFAAVAFLAAAPYIFAWRQTMQTQSPFFDELAKLMTEAAGAADGVRREAQTALRSQFQRLLADMDFVPREEFEAVRDMARAAREENEALKKRIETLEGKLGKTS
jgi:BMFP domain-containing protein YqiC